MDSVDEAAGPAAAASRRHRQAEGRPICLSIDLNEIPSPSSDTPSSTPTSGPATAPAVVLLDAYEVALRFHANPPVPQGPLAEFPGEAGVGRVSACGVCSRPETKGDTVVCDRCEKGFHLGCAKIRSRQAFSLDDWICSDCKRRRHDSKRWPLGTVSAADQRGGVRLLDINAPPPSDGDGMVSLEARLRRFQTVAVYSRTPTGIFLL
ncbi:unnamed protein product [Spirodela intermedia]|uniref:PHD-type domain-containing protein n=1 Tax=Spirodela intermedia TaxID=51605 RepID=A0A7I8JKG6_SPIIN|nr:unnamed protein product [Spirodela intermedia]CAA6670638.1 unnamed protein product [Spirodela intermedia]